jgi:hypothetical protein
MFSIYRDMNFLQTGLYEILSIYRDVERIQKGMKDQIKSKLNVFKYDLIIINYN